jgi:hypothetical protein
MKNTIKWKEKDEWENSGLSKQDSSTTNKQVNNNTAAAVKLKLTKQFLVRPIQLASGSDNVSIL